MTETTETVDPRKTPQNIEILMSDNSEEKIKLVGMTEDQEPATLTLRKQKWDEGKKEFVADPETYAEAAETLVEMGLGEAVVDGEILEEKLDELTAGAPVFQGYIDPERGFASLTPIKSFPRPIKLDSKTAKFFRSRANVANVYESYPLAEWAQGMQFQILFPASSPDGEKIDLKISQVLASTDGDEDDKKVSLKYDKGGARSIQEKLAKSTDMNADRRGKLETMFNKAVAKQRAAAVSRLSDTLGWDVEKMVEDETTVKFTVTVDQNEFNGEVHYFMVANIVGDDEEAVNSDLLS